MTTPPVFILEAGHLRGPVGTLFEVACQQVALDLAREHDVTSPPAEWVEWATQELMARVKTGGVVGWCVESPAEWKCTEALLAELDTCR